MSVSGLALALALALGPPVPTPSPEAPPERFDTLVLTPHGEAPGLAEELSLRLRERAIIPATEGRSIGERPAIWVLIDVTGSETATLRLIVSDGRMYQRNVLAPSHERARVVASTVANMVDAIEHHRLAPSEVGVEVPEPPPQKTPPPDEPARPPPPDPPEVEPRPAPPEPTNWLGPTVGGAAVLGFGPPSDSPVFGGAGGLLGLSFSNIEGVVARLEGRTVTTRRDGTRLTRVRIAITAGYLLRKNRFELGVTAGPSIEPLWVGEELTGSDGDRVVPAPLFGVLAAVDPGFDLWAEPRKVRLRLALRLELGYSFEARTPAGTVRIRSPEQSPVLRAGGLELSPLLTLESRFALP